MIVARILEKFVNQLNREALLSVLCMALLIPDLHVDLQIGLWRAALFLCRRMAPDSAPSF